MPPRQDAGSPEERVVDALFPVAIDTLYSYRVPADLKLAPGDFIAAPLGTRSATGVVWALRQGAAGNLKSVAARRDWPPLSQSMRDFIDWVAKWTLAPRGMVLRMATRGPEGLAAPAARLGVRPTGKPPARMTPARQRTLAALAADAPLAKTALAALARCSVGVIDGLLIDGALEFVALDPEPATPQLNADFCARQLEPDQRVAADALAAAVAAQATRAILLEGVTGSGKTEVYFEAIAAALRAGRQALVLLPEIALTAQFLDRFAARFGARPAEWHSGVSPRQRERLWSAVAEGGAQVVVGARSALFLPFADLGLIVVDEEHEGAYKQEDGVVYHARDMAVVRGKLESAPVVLASATPSIETRVNAERGRYDWLRLTARFGERALPELAAIDLRIEGPPRGRWLAPRLVAAIEAGLKTGDQALLFLNRRGYAPLTLCRACGHRFQCPNCSAWLVEHRFRKSLICHHCGHAEPRPDICPQCQEADTLAACGPGVERLAEEAAALFPEARMLVLSSDFPGGIEKLRAQLDAAARGDYDIIIGTQLVAKGHNFPRLTLVGIVDADVGLSNGDPRAAERTFQLLRQATGRAGRGDKPGRAMLQTWQPEHPVIAALLSGDVERFYAEETEQRRRGGLPPFGRLAAIVVSGEDRGGAEAHARALARAGHMLTGGDGWRVAPLGGAPEGNEIVLLGPAEAPIGVLRGRHRFRLALKAPRGADLQAYLRALIAAAPPARGGVRVAIDVDPQSFM
ncbi:MAG: primosomal protein N' [Bradyrhizobium sp.]|nr:MAG: primosomal protein N' [Bradyrhizobium sp.]